jgi:hypothetical protein
MARFVLAFVVIACIVLGVGVYLGWFDFSVNREKVNTDLAKAEQQARTLCESVRSYPGRRGRSGG